MILVKNKLKRLKKETDDDLLHYLRYSHLDDIPEDNFVFIPNIRTYKNIATQFPDIRNRSTQTNTMEDKATDTLDDLHKIDYKYILLGKSNKLKSEEKLKGHFEQQVNALKVVEKNRVRSKSDSSSSSSGSESLGYLRKGLRLAEMSGHAILTSLNLATGAINATMSLADFLAEATLPTQQSSSEEEVPEVAVEVAPSSSNPIPIRRERSRSRDGEGNDYNPASSSHQNPFGRERSRSRDDGEYEPDDDLGERLLRRGASRSRSSTPKGYGTKSPNGQGGYPKKRDYNKKK